MCKLVEYKLRFQQPFVFVPLIMEQYGRISTEKGGVSSSEISNLIFTKRQEVNSIRVFILNEITSCLVILP